MKLMTKLLLGFFAVSSIVLIAGAVGLVTATNIGNFADMILDEKVPIKDISMEAIISIIAARDACGEYMLNTEGLEEVEGEINEFIEDFDMWISMVLYGTESSEFKDSSAGRMYIEDGLHIVSAKGTLQMINLAEKADEYHEVFTDNSMNIIENHNERLKYNFLYADKSWDIVSFLNLVELQHVRWIEQLEHAIETTTEFTGQTDPTKCFFGKWFYAYEVDDPVLNDILKKLEPEHIALHNSAKNINALKGGNQKEAIYNSDVVPLGENIKSIFIELHDHTDQKHNGLIESERANMAALGEASSQAEEALEELEELADVEMLEAMAQADKAQETGFLFLVITIIGGVVMAVAIGVFLSKAIMKQIGGDPSFIVSVTKTVADGDLTVNLDTGKEATGVTAALKIMVSNLKDMVRQILDGASEIASSSEEMSASAQQLSEGAQTQASTLEETSASVEELTSSIGQVSGHAQSQSTAVEQSLTSMDQVQKSIEQVTKTLESVSEIVKESVERSKAGAHSVGCVVDAINLISDGSEKITGIVNVISDIADRTNLLALNASIEAARAGEHGRGFAVVADEVSKLADRSAYSTKEIEALIKESVKNVKDGVELAQESKTSMEHITEGAQKSSDMIADLSSALDQQVTANKELSKAINNINEMSQSISAATEEQSSNAKQTSKAIENVNDITQQAASASEQMASSTEELSGMAQQLQSLVAQFKVYEGEGEARHVEKRGVRELPEPEKPAVKKVLKGEEEVTGITLSEKKAKIV